ncbi:MAG: general secretion pathway protein GspK [Candidatus Omnitrophica bacterium]|nr:general secretion pathway protein GspK [Candidatus Omnitrophota bacterium]
MRRAERRSFSFHCSVENLMRVTRHVPRVTSGTDDLRSALRLTRYANGRLFDRAPFHLSKSSQTGSLLIITLWLIAVLTVAAVALGRYLSIETRLMRYHLAVAQAKALARGGVYLAMERLAQDLASTQPPHDWLGEEWAYTPPEEPGADPVWIVPFSADSSGAATPPGRITIRMTDEERKLNLNQITEPTVRPIFQALLGGPEPTNLLVDAVDADQQPEQPGGLEEQPQPPPGYAAKNGPIRVLEEVREIPGITDAVFSILQDYASTNVAQDSHRVNINTAPLPILNEIFTKAGYPTLAQQALDFRWDPEDGVDLATGKRFTNLNPVEVNIGPLGFKDDLTQAMGSLGGWLGVQSSRFTIVSTGRMTTPPVQYRIEAVVDREASGDSTLTVGGAHFQVLRWHED